MTPRIPTWVLRKRTPRFPFSVACRRRVGSPWQGPHRGHFRCPQPRPVRRAWLGPERRPQALRGELNPRPASVYTIFIALRLLRTPQSGAVDAFPSPATPNPGTTTHGPTGHVAALRNSTYAPAFCTPPRSPSLRPPHCCVVPPERTPKASSRGPSILPPPFCFSPFPAFASHQHAVCITAALLDVQHTDRGDATAPPSSLSVHSFTH